MRKPTATDVLLGGFYGVVAVTALTGQATGAAERYGWPLLPAAVATGAVEFGSITLAAFAASRRRLGERAWFVRVLSFAVAAFAVIFQLVSHSDRVLAAFFAGMSALGYLVYLAHSSARLRDHQRANGNAERAAQQTAAIAELLRRKLSQDREPLAAQIITTVYDINQIAGRLRERADYDGLTAILSEALVPTQVVKAPTQRSRRTPQPTSTPAAPAAPRKSRAKATTPAQPRKSQARARKAPKPVADVQDLLNVLPANAPTSPAPAGPVTPSGLLVARTMAEATA